MLKGLINTGKKKLVFHLGVNAGFFSEYNNMLLAILYCLQNGIKFVLYSRDANFSYNSGWEDYFLTFSAVSNHHFNTRFNFRSQDEYLYYKTKKLDRNTRIYKWLTGTDYLTYDLFEIVRKDAMKFNTSEVPGHIETDHIINVLHELDREVFRYNEETRLSINELIGKLNIKGGYVGFHIRSGDKIKESQAHPIREYILKASEHTSLRTAFISTDDFQIIVKLKDEFKDWIFYYLCPENRKGYFQKEFEATLKKNKKDAMIELFASIELLSSSSLFVGTFSSNIGMYVGIRKKNLNCYGVDFDTWRIW
jgi:hypothetical protein